MSMYLSKLALKFCFPLLEGNHKLWVVLEISFLCLMVCKKVFRQIYPSLSLYIVVLEQILHNNYMASELEITLSHILHMHTSVDPSWNFLRSVTSLLANWTGERALIRVHTSDPYATTDSATSYNVYILTSSAVKILSVTLMPAAIRAFFSSRSTAALHAIINGHITILDTSPCSTLHPQTAKPPYYK